MFTSKGVENDQKPVTLLTGVTLLTASGIVDPELNWPQGWSKTVKIGL